MKLITKCKSCKNDIALKSSATDRIDLAKEKGETFLLQCPECSQKGIFHINEIKAKETREIKIIAFCISILGTPVIGYYLWGYLARPHNPYVAYAICFVMAFPIFVSLYLVEYQLNNVRRFNKYWG